MRNIIIYTTICLTAVMSVLSSCEKTMDINKDPNYPGDVPISMLLPSAELSFAGILGGEMELVGSMWCQHYTQNVGANQYNTTVNYTISNTSYPRFWSIPYTHSLPDLKIIAQKAIEEGADNYYMVSEIMTCFIYHILANWYENIPYSEALMGDKQLYPKYDNGKAVNRALIERLNTALGKAKSAAKSKVLMGKEDIINGGDMNKWVQFGNSLKLKLLMLDFNNNKATIEALLAEDNFLKSDCKIDLFTNKENNSNPLYEYDRRKLNTDQNLAASKTLVKFLNKHDDPRIEAFYERNKIGGYYGLDQGVSPNLNFFIFIAVCRAKLAPQDPVYFISYAETCFLKAEAYARLGRANEAKAAYNSAVTAAFERWGYNAQTFIKDGGPYALNTSSVETMLKSILTQKWVASARSQAWDSFFDINRTGIPALGSKLASDDAYTVGELAPVIDSALNPDEYPKRMIYPKISTENNPNAPEPLSLTQKQWWHK